MRKRGRVNAHWGRCMVGTRNENDVISWQFTHGLLSEFCVCRRHISYYLEIINDFRYLSRGGLGFSVASMSWEEKGVSRWSDINS